MKCPRCGAEIREGYLYCESCGEDIHIVPDFEPEIEYSMRETLSGIAEEMKEPASGGKQKKSKLRIGKKQLYLGIAGVSFLVLAVAGILILQQIRFHSVSYQLTRAAACFQAGNTERAMTYYERAHELEEENIPLCFTLAELYRQSGREGQYLDLLFFIIRSEAATEDETASAYKKIIAYYSEQGDYASINTILMNTEKEEIRVMFQSYMALPPEFSYQEGAYDSVIPLKLTASTQGTIYYTTDGTVPTTESKEYMTPIFLDAGNYTVSAMFVNTYGIASEVVAKSYVIDVAKPSAPEVETYSGEYTSPVLIKVTQPMDGEVYYTTDGSVPTEHSQLYTAPIPMPLGRSVFTFVTYNEDGICGACTTREFELTLDTESTPEQAVAELVTGLVKTGRLADVSGTPASGELSGRYLYQYQYVLAIPEQGDFYLVAEVFEDSAGVQTRTGTVYGVEVYSLACYKLTKGALDEYIAEAVQ